VWVGAGCSGIVVASRKSLEGERGLWGTFLEGGARLGPPGKGTTSWENVLLSWIALFQLKGWSRGGVYVPRTKGTEMGEQRSHFNSR